MEKRINWIDWAKVFAIIMVVFSHFSFTTSHIYFKYFVDGFHVPVFFFLSGYLFKSTDKFEPFLSKNFKSLVIPYILLNLICLLFYNLPVMFYSHDFSNLGYLIKNFFIWHGHAPAGPCWFLMCLFLVRIYAYFLFKLKQSIQITVIIVSPIIAYLILKGFHYDYLYFKIDAMLVAIVPFMIGFFSKKTNAIKTFDSKYYTMAITIICLITLVYITSLQGRVSMIRFGNYPSLYFIQMALGCIMVIAFSTLLNNIELKLIKTISIGTIIILAFHCPIYNLCCILISIVGLNVSLLVLNVILAFFIVFLFYYPIIFIKKHMPIIMGK